MVVRKKKTRKTPAAKPPVRGARGSSRRAALTQTTTDPQNKLEAKLDKLEKKLDKSEIRKDILGIKLDALDTKFVMLETKADIAETKLDKIEEKLDRRTGPPNRRLSAALPDKQFEKSIREVSRLFARLPATRLASPPHRMMGDTGAPTGPTTPTGSPEQIEKELDALEKELDFGELIWAVIEQMVDMLEKFLDVNEKQWDELEKTLDQHESHLDQRKRR